MLVDPEEFRDFEIVIGLVAPIGTDLDRVIERLRAELELSAYPSDVIRLSHLLDGSPVGEDLPSAPAGMDYYAKRMNSGDQLRRLCGSGDALAAYAISEMRERRREATGKADDQERRFAWILRTIKHEDEVSLLRTTYGRRFILLAVGASEETRRSRLKGELTDSATRTHGVESEVAALLERDELDATDSMGQHVREIYSKSNYFIDLDSQDHLDQEVARLIGLLFGEPFVTPRRDELGMFLAQAVALRSSDAGRQVGAVITAPSGDVLALGANEVPQPGGGEYWSDDSPDNRDFQLGYDFNKRAIRRAARELLDALAHNGHLRSELAELESGERLERILAEDPERRLRDSRAMSLIEFGRIVHAEMAAITQAARSAGGLIGSTLYTTAFPCHMCMRLIISCGISRVVYVDPYPKSLASEMYQSEICLESSTTGAARVSIQPFWGVAPSIYREVFAGTNRRRRDDGTYPQWDRKGSRMRLAEPDPLVKAAELEKQVPIALAVALNLDTPPGPSVSG